MRLLRNSTRHRAALLGVPLALALGASALAPNVASAAPTQRSHQAGASSSASYLHWVPRPIDTTARFRGLAAVNHKVAWVAGSLGNVLRTTDGGKHWKDVSPPASMVKGSDGNPVQFRDIQAWGTRTAIAMSVGNGTDSRILLTRNGGRTWKTTYTSHTEAAFFDCMGFFDRKHGLVMSDPVNGKFRIVSTSNGGKSWHIMSRKGMPPALSDEFGFAGSGTCLVTHGKRNAWLASGGGTGSRVFHTSDRGHHWTVATTKIGSSDSAGIFSLAFQSNRKGIAVGGDYLAPDNAIANAATTSSRGRHWTLAKGLPGGYRSGSTYWPGTVAGYLAVGPTGSDVSWNGGRTWTTFDTGSYDAVQCAKDGACWASGDAGAVARLSDSAAG